MTETTRSYVTLLGAGAVSLGDIEEILPLAPRLIAADGGAGPAIEAGYLPDLVIGDLDSLPQFARDALPESRLIRVDEQDSTDFEKCLIRIDAPLILALGFTGRRADHELAVYNTLIRVGTPPCIVIGSHDIAFRASRRLDMALDPGTRVSLFPMGEVAGTSEGLKWPIDGIRFAPDGRIGTSNEATGPVSLTFDAEAMLVITPREALAAAIAALAPG